MRTAEPSSTAEQLFSVEIRSGRDVQRVTTGIEDAQREVRTLCECLDIDAMAVERICAGVQRVLSQPVVLADGETIVFCDCDAQFAGICRPPDRFSANPCHADAAPVLRQTEAPYFFPVGALEGTGPGRTPGTPLKLQGQRVEIRPVPVTAHRDSSASQHNVPSLGAASDVTSDTWSVPV